MKYEDKLTVLRQNGYVSYNRVENYNCLVTLHRYHSSGVTTGTDDTWEGAVDQLYNRLKVRLWHEVTYVENGCCE